METPGQRLKYYIEEVIMESPSSFSEIIGLREANTIANYCRNAPMTTKMLKKMVMAIKDFPLEWIKTGEGERPKIGSGVKKSLSLLEEKQDFSCLLCKEKDFIIAELKEIIEGYKKQEAYIFKVKDEIISAQTKLIDQLTKK